MLVPRRLNGIYFSKLEASTKLESSQQFKILTTRHYGDLGNILLVDRAHELNITDEVISLEPEVKEYIGGRGIVLHQLPDDFSRGSTNQQTFRI